MKRACDNIESNTQYDWVTLSGNGDAECHNYKKGEGNINKRNTKICKKCVYNKFTPTHPSE